MTVLTYGGLVFDDEATTGFTLSKLVGWYDAAPTRYEATTRPQGNGSFRPGTIYRDPRVVSVQGSWSGDTLDQAYAARNQLAALAANESTMTVTDPVSATSITAGVSTAPTMDDGLFQPFFKYAFDVIASDPFRYGTEVTTSTGVPTASSGLVWPLGTTAGKYFDWGTAGASGRLLVSNAGSALTYSTFKVTGGISGGFELVWVPTGARLRYERAIPAGSTVTLNARTGRVTVDGNSDATGFLTTSQWWSVPPGTSGEVQFTPLGVITGTPTLTALTAPAHL